MKLSLIFGCCLWINLLAGQDNAFEPAVQGIYLVNPSYQVDFDSASRIAYWVHYELNAQEADGQLKRTDDFRIDFRTKRSASTKSYRGSGYDRGHLKPAADSKSSRGEMSQSFLMTNMFPQTPSLNRGIWRKLEEQVREWAIQYRTVHVTTGPSLETHGWLVDGVRVSTACWKAVLRTSPDTCAIAFVMPNASRVSGEIDWYMVSIDELECQLQRDLFPGLPDSTEVRIEANARLSDWKLTSSQSMKPVSSEPASAHERNNPSIGSVQCIGIAKSTGQRCRIKTSDPSGKCRYHRD